MAMLHPTVFFLYLWTLQVTFSAGKECRDPCACMFNDPPGTYVDLSLVGRRDGPPRFSMVPVVSPEKSSVALYSYNPCYSISYHSQEFEPDRYTCSDAAACVITPGNSSGYPATQRALGYQKDAVFILNGEDVMINYTSGHADRKPFVVTVTCSANDMYRLEIANETFFTLFTKCACQNMSKTEICMTASPSPKSGGLSTGSILLITFFVILFVYVGFGILFNFCKGAHGTELFPNYEFWNELPKLIVDGFLFTCSCFGRRSSYADV